LKILADAEDEVNRLNKRRNVPWSGYFFETRPGQSISNSGNARAVQRFCKAMGNKVDERWGNWSPHDLRRTMRTGLSACRVRPDIAELAIGHTKRGILAVYDQYGFDEERRDAMLAWEARLLAIVAGRDPDAENDKHNVVKMVG